MSRPGFYFCICPDWELIKEHIFSLIEKYGFRARIRLFWSDEGIGEDFWSCFMQRALFKNSVVVVVRKAELLGEDFWNKMEQILARFYPRIWPFFCVESLWTKGKVPRLDHLKSRKFWSLAEERGWIWTSAGVTLTNVVNVFVRMVKREGIDVSYGECLSLKDLLPLDGVSLKGEVKKLKMLLKADGRTKAMARDVLKVISPSGFDVFSAIKILEDENVSKEHLWKSVLERKDEEVLFFLIALLFREAKILWLVKTGRSVELKLPESVVNLKKKVAERISLKDLLRLMSLILDIEVAVKSGLTTFSQAIEFLIAESSLIFSSSRYDERKTLSGS